MRRPNARIAGPRTLSHRLVFALLGMLGVFLAVFVGTLLWLAREHDSLAADKSGLMFEAGLDSRTETLVSFAVDYSYWDAATGKVAARDLEWIADNMMIFTDGPFDLLVIVYPDGTELGWRDDGGAEPRAGLLPAALRDRLVAAQHAAEARPHPTSVEAAVVDGEIWQFATAQVGTHTRPNTEAELASAPVTVFGRRLTAAAVAEIGDAAFVDGAGLRSGAVEDGGLDALPVLAANGDPVAWMTWPRPAPGTEILRNLALPIALILAGAVGISLAIGRHVRRSAARLEDALDDALLADRAKSEFLTTISHELRTPMNGVLGIAQILETTPLDEDQTELIGMLKDSAESQAALIEDLLSFGEIEAGAMRLVLEPVDLPDLLREATATARLAALAKGVELRVEAPEGAPPVLSDAKRLRQVIVNLTGNAAKFTDSGRIQVTAELAPAGDGDARLRIAVRDTGPGIPADQQARIFDRFTQVDGSIGRRKGGTGLGLAICRAIARELSGDVDVRSVPGQGATFTLDIPVPLADGATSAEPLRAAA